ncbi:MAG: DUF4325 domain-containing protein [Candidatus Moranbacteria bacterium]|nr:DUF4325 domain-containing protein [Candidatus Moranbacteria bacterium]
MSNLNEIILNLAQKNEKIKTSDVLASLNKKLSRTYISRIINALVKEGKLVKGGSTAGAFYVLPENENLIQSEIIYKKIFLREGLEEHRVLDEINHTRIYLDLKDNVRSIFNYAFSEMLNNAIEHSQSEKISVSVFKSKKELVFFIDDYGIGVFRNIKHKKELKSELEAIQDLLKGKTTTAPQLHTGEGIFFTSKVANLFTLESFGLRLMIDNNIKDIFVSMQNKKNKGTRVIFAISLDSNIHLAGIFRKYQTNQDTMAFDKTEVKIKLFTMGTVHVSRSQARRVLNGLNKFKTIVMDFDKVPVIGQGFADEIFRVYKSKHPEINITPINMNEAVKFMINRVEKPDFKS